MEMNLSSNENKSVYHMDNLIIRQADECSEEIHHFIRYLLSNGLPVEQPIEIANGHEYFEFVEAEMVHPNKWSDDALYEVGRFVRRLHNTGSEYCPIQPNSFRPWYLREIGTGNRIWCHGDIAPWNMLTMGGKPYKLIDWEYSGLLDPLVELARVCWLFVQLCDDDLAKKYELPSPEKRASQVRVICDGYELDKSRRQLLTNQIIEVIVCETAHEAIDPGLNSKSEGNLWGFAWRTRSLYWIWRHKKAIESALI